MKTDLDFPIQSTPWANKALQVSFPCSRAARELLLRISNRRHDAAEPGRQDAVGPKVGLTASCPSSVAATAEGGPSWRAGIFETVWKLAFHSSSIIRNTPFLSS